MLHICLSAALYRPIEVHQAIIESDSCPLAGVECNDTSDCRFLSTIHENDPTVMCNTGRNPSNMNDLPHTPSIFHSVEDLCTDSTVYYKDNVSHLQSPNTDECKPPKTDKSEADKCLKTKNCRKFFSALNYIDLSLINNPLFLLMALTVMLMAVGCPHALFYLPSYANSLGLERSECSLLLSISAVFDLAGRLGLGYIADLNLFSKYKAYSAR